MILMLILDDLTFPSWWSQSMLRFFDRKGRLRLLGHHRNGVMVRCLAYVLGGVGGVAGGGGGVGVGGFGRCQMVISRWAPVGRSTAEADVLLAGSTSNKTFHHSAHSIFLSSLTTHSTHKTHVPRRCYPGRPYSVPCTNPPNINITQAGGIHWPEDCLHLPRLLLCSHRGLCRWGDEGSPRSESMTLAVPDLFRLLSLSRLLQRISLIKYGIFHFWFGLQKVHKTLIPFTFSALPILR